MEGILGDLRESDVTAISLFLQLGNRTYFGLSWGLKASGQWLPLIKVSVSIRAGFTSEWGSVHSEPRQNASCRQRGACFHCLSTVGLAALWRHNLGSCPSMGFCGWRAKGLGPGPSQQEAAGIT